MEPIKPGVAERPWLRMVSRPMLIVVILVLLFIAAPGLSPVAKFVVRCTISQAHLGGICLIQQARVEDERYANYSHISVHLALISQIASDGVL